MSAHCYKGLCATACLCSCVVCASRLHPVSWSPDYVAESEQPSLPPAGTFRILNATVQEGPELARALGAIKRVGAVLSANGCDCECDHHSEEHDDDCERCLACRIQDALQGEEARVVEDREILATFKVYVEAHKKHSLLMDVAGAEISDDFIAAFHAKEEAFKDLMKLARKLSSRVGAGGVR